MLKNLKIPVEQWGSLKWLESVGFKVNPNAQCVTHIEEVKTFCQYWDVHRQNLPYATDGVVIKIESFELQNLAVYIQLYGPAVGMIRKILDT